LIKGQIFRVGNNPKGANNSDSHGYRPGKSAIEAVGEARERCRNYNWLLDLAIKGFFETVADKELMRQIKQADFDWASGAKDSYVPLDDLKNI
jgi:hypothetical protein